MGNLCFNEFNVRSSESNSWTAVDAVSVPPKSFLQGCAPNSLSCCQWWLLIAHRHAIYGNLPSTKGNCLSPKATIPPPHCYQQRQCHLRSRPPLSYPTDELYLKGHFMLCFFPFLIPPSLALLFSL